MSGHTTSFAKRSERSLRISDVHFIAASPAQAEAGLLGFVCCSVNSSLRLDGIALRRTAGDRLALSFPARRDSSGRQHFYVRPVDDRARREIEHAVLRALGLEAEARR